LLFFVILVVIFASLFATFWLRFVTSSTRFFCKFLLICWKLLV